MQNKIILFIILILISCVSEKRTSYNLQYSEINFHANKFIKRVDHLTNMQYGELIIKYDLLSIESHNNCIFSNLSEKIFYPKNIGEKSYINYLNKIEKIIENKIAKDNWLDIIYVNLDRNIRYLEPLKLLKIYNKNIIEKSDSILNKSDIFSLIETKANHRDVIDKFKKLSSIDDVVSSVPILKPLSRSIVTSHFSLRKDPITKKMKKHLGIDLKGEHNASIYSTAKGIVRFAGVNGGYGNLIIIDHSTGYSTRYAHLDKIFIQKGKRIAANQLIATQGNTGRSTGEHLHYEIRFKEEAINPKQFLDFNTECSIH